MSSHLPQPQLPELPQPQHPSEHPRPQHPPQGTPQIAVTVFGMLAPSTLVRPIGHGHLARPRFVTAAPDLDAVLNGATRAWPVRVVVSWSGVGSSGLESHEVTAFATSTQPGPESPTWGLELATDSAAPLPQPSGPGVPSNIFCVLFPWASFCH